MTIAFRLARVLGLAAWALAVASSEVGAQDMCRDDDAGLCEDDGGMDAPPNDGGGDPEPGADAGVRRDAGTDGAGDGIACSCHTDSEVDRGARIHVCTESFDPEVCRDFDCERGTVRSRGCPDEAVRLCCVMRSRDLQTSLYEDCAHPNCESGFREQCREFGGTVSDGPCAGPGGGGPGGDGDGDDDSGDGLCAVHAGNGPPSLGAYLVLSVLALFALRVSRRAARRLPRAAWPPRRP